jgi:hypothetical protein
MNDRSTRAPLTAAVAGAVAGATVALLISRSSGPASRAAILEPIEVLSERSAAMSDRLDDLIDAHGELVARVDRLDLRSPDSLASPDRSPLTEPTDRAPVGDFATRAELDELRKELARLQGLESGVGVPEQGFEDQVKSALKQVRQEERVDGVRRYQDARRERLDKDMLGLRDALSLDSRQEEDLRAALLAQYDREDALTRLWEEGVEAEVLGEQKAEALSAFQADLESALTEEQVQSFWSTVAKGSGGGGQGK